ncbi:MAG: hypothetical protein LBQ12_12765 [Deltaproteobacteria bacterium]|jgi:hypothetical protein|nr:hypothetical protein [Deltaproteobacteria bacterium]
MLNGLAATEAAVFSGASEPSVRLWLKTFPEGGLEALRNASRLPHVPMPCSAEDRSTLEKWSAPDFPVREMAIRASAVLGVSDGL